MVVPAISWICVAFGKIKAAKIIYYISQASLAMSCVVIVWGISKMVIFFGSFDEMLPNKITIIMHIFAYLFVIIANVLQLILADDDDGWKDYEILTICLFVIYFFCNLVFGFILNTIITKIEIATSLAISEGSSLIEPGSFIKSDSECTSNNIGDNVIDGEDDN